MTPRRDSGFTLLEILVALVVLGFLMVGLAQGTRFGVATWHTQLRTIAARDDMDATDRALRRLIAQMFPGTYTDPPSLQGTADGFAFTTRLPLSADALPTREADVALLVDRSHRLILRWTPHHHGEPVARPPKPQEAELLPRLNRVEFAYYGATTPGQPAAWRTAWSGPGLPDLVRIRLVFPAKDPRHWPDIVAAPMRERPAD